MFPPHSTDFVHPCWCSPMFSIIPGGVGIVIIHRGDPIPCEMETAHDLGIGPPR